jgi:hypothetical protein
LTCLLTLLLLLLLSGDYPESLKTCAKDLLPSILDLPAYTAAAAAAAAAAFR